MVCHAMPANDGGPAGGGAGATRGRILLLLLLRGAAPAVALLRCFDDAASSIM